VRRSLLSVTLIVAVLCASAAPASARPQWKRDLDRIVRGKSIGVRVGEGGRTLYSHSSKTRRVPASNQKLLLSMALLDRFEPGHRIPTSVLGARVTRGVLRGNLFIVGRGDPTLATSGRFAENLPFEPAYLGRLATKLKKAGLRRIKGRVVGVHSYFAHDWWASGWKSSFRAMYAPLASALNINGNVHNGRHIDNPEWRAAKLLTEKLRATGVRVGGSPIRGGAPAPGAEVIAQIESPPLSTMLRYMNRKSSNFFAEVLGKRLGVERSGPLGTMAKGARAIEAWAARYHASVVAHDSSGLSSSNRASPKAITKLIYAAERQPWGARLRDMLPRGGEGTLEDRLKGVRVRAKTGTLDSISTLAGWVKLKRTKSWAAFSLMSKGMPKSTAARLEDRIMRLLRRRARP